jgi:predicted RecB family nuclease
MESDFITWMDRYHREHPGELTPDETDESLMILAKKGIEHEKAFLASLQDQGLDVCVIARGTNAASPDANPDTANPDAPQNPGANPNPDAPQNPDATNPTSTPSEQTLTAMHSARAYIYQAAISDPHSNFHGVADFLVKVPGPSSLGDYHYEPWDTKLALKPKPYYIIQLCCYAEILQSIQAVLPATISVVLGSKDTKAFRTEDYYFYYKQLKARFLTQQAAFDPSQRPTPTGLDDHGRWSTIAKQILEEKDDLSRVANIRKTQIKRLSQNGITTLRALAESTAAYLPKMKSIDIRNTARPRPRFKSHQSACPSQNMSKSAKAKTPGAASPSCHRRHPTTSGSTWRATPTCKAA